MKEYVGLCAWVNMCVEERRNTGFNLYLPTKNDWLLRSMRHGEPRR